MKKVLSILVLVLATVQMAFAGDVITRDAKQLPLTARNFINQYSPNRKYRISRSRPEYWDQKAMRCC